jgi:hypothetical protein
MRLRTLAAPTVAFCFIFTRAHASDKVDPPFEPASFGVNIDQSLINPFDDPASGAASPSPVAQNLACGVPADNCAHSAPGMCRGPALIEPFERTAIVSPVGRRTGPEKLIDQ